MQRISRFHKIKSPEDLYGGFQVKTYKIKSSTLVMVLLFAQDQVYSKTIITNFPNKLNQNYLIHPKEIGEERTSFAQDQVYSKTLVTDFPNKSNQNCLIHPEKTSEGWISFAQDQVSKPLLPTSFDKYNFDNLTPNFSV